MKTIRARSHVDKDGRIQIQLPEYYDEDVEILLVYQPVQETPKRQWPQKFLDLYGAWEGEPLERGPQGILPERDPLF